MKERFKDKWNRTPSAKLTEELRAQLKKYQTHLQTAGELATPLSHATSYAHPTESADVTVRAKYDQHVNMMQLLCQPADQLVQQVPKPTKQAAIATGSKVSGCVNCHAQWLP